MQKQIQSLPYIKLNQMEYFKEVKFDDKNIYWEEEEKKSIIPLRISLDSILFALRE
jgi:hypothetical protein